MPLNKVNLISKLIEALKIRDDNPERSVEEIATDLANAIEEYIKSGDVVGITTGVSVSVSTTGSASAQTGSGTGTGTQTGVGKIR